MGLTPITVGIIAAMLFASSNVSPGENFLGPFDFSSDCSSLAFWVSLIGLIMMLFAPINLRSEEHTSELQSLMRLSYAVFCLIKKKNTQYITTPFTTIHRI